MNTRTLMLALAMLMPVGVGALPVAAPPDGGTIAIEPRMADGGDDASATPYVNAAREALAGRGFTILEDPDHAAYVAELVLSRADAGTGSAKISGGGVSATPGALGGAGAGVVVPLAAGTRLVPIQRTRMELHIRKRGETSAVWDGAATTVRTAGSRRGDVDTVAADLSMALLRNYPATPDGDIGVP